MKKLSIKKGVQCMACLECVRACSNAYYKEFHPDKAALKIVQRGRERPSHGLCPVRQVRRGLSLRRDHPEPQGRLDDQPPSSAPAAENALKRVPSASSSRTRPSPYSSKCTACGICVKACPMELLEIVEK